MSVSATVSDLCEWTGGELIHGQTEQAFQATVIDSRQVDQVSLFVAIIGPNHDAHDFVDQVLESGAAGVLVSKDAAKAGSREGDAFVVRVDDTTTALADLARGHRSSFEGPVIGITGSNGKTTTKDLCAGILDGLAPTLATRGNLNNNFGVPLTLLRREEADRHAVIEMGMNHRGEIATLAEIARPTIGVLTNIGTAHIEFLGSREAIAQEKGDLLAALPQSGTAIVGRDDPLALGQVKRTAATVLTFGFDGAADLQASKIQARKDGTYTFELESPFGRGEIRVPGLAETIVSNALAASAAAFAAGASMDAVAAGLESHPGVAGRMQPRALANDILLIDDSYNANPQSMRSALETLARLETSGHRVAVLGEMGELGGESEKAHRETGTLAGALSLDGLYLVGPSAQLVAEGARSAGLSQDRIHVARDQDELLRRLREDIGKGDRILIKGSRAAEMERVVDALERGSH